MGHIHTVVQCNQGKAQSKRAGSTTKGKNSKTGRHRKSSSKWNFGRGQLFPLWSLVQFFHLVKRKYLDAGTATWGTVQKKNPTEIYDSAIMAEKLFSGSHRICPWDKGFIYPVSWSLYPWALDLVELLDFEHFESVITANSFPLPLSPSIWVLEKEKKEKTAGLY